VVTPVIGKANLDSEDHWVPLTPLVSGPEP
jgi:hypothetical protein